MNNPVNTYHLQLTGIVQGVGFRPALYQLAMQNGWKGYVCNAGDGLHVEFNATAEASGKIVQEILAHAPSLARIESQHLSVVTAKEYAAFSIIESDTTAGIHTALTPDFALCDQCRQELHDPLNRRYHYPFITCTRCGPRYSIIQQMPYDRPFTSMAAFPMCAACQAEYADVQDRRYYSQTNSCPACGIRLSVYDHTGQQIESGNEASLAIINTILRAGKIAAVKGIGGYLLLCDAGHASGISRLRQRKHRPTKPFAVLCQHIRSIRQLAFCSAEEQAWLESVAAPILLLRARPDIHQQIAQNMVAPGLTTAGLMLPNAPLLELISEQFGKPLICTSANISGSPIIYKDEDAVAQLTSIADIVVTHNREILIPQDDSVVRLTPRSQQAIILRRSRGLAPSLFNDSIRPQCSTLATGALLKSSFTLTQQQYIYSSQYLGSTESYEAQEMYRQTLAHLLETLKAQPALILCDQHPDYFSTQLAKEMAGHYKVPLQAIQHHKAHFAAVLAENNLQKYPEPVLGVIWDGTGLGEDKNSWGGEFFTYKNNAISRFSHFAYFPVLLGDKMAREPRLSALAACHQLAGMEEILKKKFDPTEWKLYRGLLQQQAPVQSSSVGRIFDAAASLLGLPDKQHYEGEAALLLETAAMAWFEANGYDAAAGYYGEETAYHPLPIAPLFNGIIRDIREDKEPGLIAARFHFSLVQAIQLIARYSGCRCIAFSGGVFQNGLLVDLVQHHLGQNFRLCFHQQLSPNDENISLGQLVYQNWEISNAASGKTFDKLEEINEIDAGIPPTLNHKPGL